MPLVINSLGGWWTHTNTHMQTRTYTDICTETILRNQAHAFHRPACTWFKISKLASISSACSIAAINVLPTVNHWICGIHSLLGRSLQYLIYTNLSIFHGIDFHLLFSFVVLIVLIIPFI